MPVNGDELVKAVTVALRHSKGCAGHDGTPKFLINDAMFECTGIGRLVEELVEVNILPDDGEAIQQVRSMIQQNLESLAALRLKQSEVTDPNPSAAVTVCLHTVIGSMISASQVLLAFPGGPKYEDAIAHYASLHAVRTVYNVMAGMGLLDAGDAITLEGFLHPHLVAAKRLLQKFQSKGQEKPTAPGQPPEGWSPERN